MNLLVWLYIFVCYTSLFLDDDYKSSTSLVSIRNEKLTTWCDALELVLVYLVITLWGFLKLVNKVWNMDKFLYIKRKHYWFKKTYVITNNWTWMIKHTLHITSQKERKPQVIWGRLSNSWNKKCGMKSKKM